MGKDVELAVDEDTAKKIKSIAESQGISVDELVVSVLDQFLRGTNSFSHLNQSGVTKIGPKK